MIGLVRAAVFGFLALSVVYVMVSIYSRSVRRERLEKEWDTDPAREGLTKAERDAYIATGMAEYQGGLRRKLIALVYVIPALAFGVIVYVVNAQ
jgi:Ca2+/Na+ antiporter